MNKVSVYFIFFLLITFLVWFASGLDHKNDNEPFVQESQLAKSGNFDKTMEDLAGDLSGLASAIDEANKEIGEALCVVIEKVETPGRWIKLAKKLKKEYGIDINEFELAEANGRYWFKDMVFLGQEVKIPCKLMFSPLK